MSNRVKIGILIVLGFGLLLLFYYITPEKNKGEEVEEDLPRKELLKQKLNKNGVYILYSLIESYPKVLSLEKLKDPIDSTLTTIEGDYPNVYLLIDNELKISDEAVSTLMDFVEEGNSAFVSVTKFNSNFSNKFVYGKLTNAVWESEITLDFTHDSIMTDYEFFFSKYKNNEVFYKTWNYFVPSNFKVGLDKVATLSYGTDMNPVFVKIPYGKGFFYLHAIPEVFFNESMFNEDGFTYAERVMSHLPVGHYKWHTHLDMWNPSNDVNPYDDSNITIESPIQYILKDVNLRWAYLLLLGSLFTYVFFKTKRKQKIIATIEPNENNSLEFIETVSKLYLKQDKHYKFIKHYEQSFMHFIKDRYYISSPTIDEAYINSVNLKSDVSKELIIKIFKEFEEAKKAYSYSTDKLIALHKKIEYFYKNCK